MIATTWMLYHLIKLDKSLVKRNILFLCHEG